MSAINPIQILTDLVNIKTVGGNELAVANYLKRFFNEHGITNVKVLEQRPGRANLVAEIGDGNGPKLGLEGHEDTVHEGNLKTWHTDPFKAVVKGDQVYGRGTSDMKSGLAALAIALVRINEAHPNLHGTVRFLATISEEVDQGGANYLSEHGYVDDLDALIIGEPSNGKIITAHKGSFIYTVESFGKAAHSSRPEQGIDAIEKLIHYRELEKQLFADHHEQDVELGHTIYTPDIFKGGAQVNSIPDYAYQKVMVRTIPEFNNDVVTEQLQQLIDCIHQTDPESDLKLTVNFSGYPVQTDNEDLVQLVQRLSQQDLSNELGTRTSSGGTDASQYTQRNHELKVVICGPGNDTSHQANEHVSVHEYQDFIRLYTDTIEDIVNKVSIFN